MSQGLEQYVILVLGKSGTGRSAVCNTLLGDNKFPVGSGMSVTTTTAQCEVRYYDNMVIRIIDTPDITNCDMFASEKLQEVDRWKKLGATPDLVLVTVRCDLRYSSEEYAILKEIQRLWGRDNSLEPTLVVAFTFGDYQDYPIEDDLKDPPPELRELLRRANKRYMVFNNKKGADRDKQAHKCFELMKNIRANSGKTSCSFL